MGSLSPQRKSALRRELETIVGVGGVLSDPEELLVYESDGLTLFRALADFIVFPRSTEDVSTVVGTALTVTSSVSVPGCSVASTFSTSATCKSMFWLTYLLKPLSVP